MKLTTLLLAVTAGFQVHFSTRFAAAVPNDALSSPSYLDGLSTNQQRLFEYAMKGLDINFAPPFLFSSPRYSAWYAVGLLARAQGDDIATASKIIQDVISYQFTDPTKLWFGTFKSTIDAPDPGAIYTPKPYGSYDANQGLFVCTAWIIAMEEFQHLLDPSLVALMKRSMYNATVGDGYRIGGVDGDNLYPVYSNPWYMRVMSATYVGHMMGDANMTYWGNEWARQAIAEFDRYATLSEFNSGTYTGVTLYALSLWGYMPANSTIAGRAADIITKTWESIGNFWNPALKTLGGPWDRSYGFSMKSYVGILGAQITGIVGGLDDGSAPLPLPLVGSAHYGDAAIIALTPLISKFHDKYVSPAVRSKLVKFSDRGHAYAAQAVSPPFDNLAYPRNYTSWTQAGLSVGGIEVDSNVVGGPATNPTNFAPGVILWDAGQAGTGWISHYSTSRTIRAVATSQNLTISYPPSRAFPNLATGISKTMTLLISGFRHVSLSPDFLANGTAVLPGLRLSVSGNVAVHGARFFQYGVGTINDLMYYNLTYAIPDGLEGVPEVTGIQAPVKSETQAKVGRR
ncbi:hypothetical protein LshimejAT787_1202480 [Lyophyllum shimeji]|uniref:Uncharacterized protein n=1 Tax=Lyophyllum shimeji TaxID=47721 RepID=A0A9P3PWD4_LYOSH|nr:hypothetical protein LshimejAT787_1202480 [Lyophyllum shimeji]